MERQNDWKLRFLKPLYNIFQAYFRICILSTVDCTKNKFILTEIESFKPAGFFGLALVERCCITHHIADDMNLLRTNTFPLKIESGNCSWCKKRAGYVIS
ncbi:hypothetical protein A9L43_04480 [Pseudomonas mosselii]|nr:hypothetical protein A9L43_04480 [Pseudomonas mosselii]